MQRPSAPAQLSLDNAVIGAELIHAHEEAARLGLVEPRDWTAFVAQERARGWPYVVVYRGAAWLAHADLVDVLARRRRRARSTEVVALGRLRLFKVAIDRPRDVAREVHQLVAELERPAIDGVRRRIRR